MLIAVAGIGRVAQDHYLPYLAGLDDTRLVVWNRTTEPAQVAAERYGIQTTSSLDDLAAARPDVTFVLTSERARLDVTTRLVEQGVRDLFLEKPLSARAGQAHVDETDFGEVLQFRRHADQAGVRAAMQFNYRYFASTQAALDWRHDPRLGALTAVVSRAHFACWSHVLDLVRLFAGDPVRLSATAGAVARTGAGITAPDLAASLVTAEGVTVTLLGSAAGAWELPLFDVTLEFEGGRIRLWDLDGGASLQVAGVPGTEEITDPTPRPQRYAASFRAALDSYFAARAAGGETPVTLLDGVQQVRLDAAIRRAIRLERGIDIEEELSL